MNELLNDSSVAWAALLVVLLPLVIIGTGELEERLRQSDSPLRPAVSILRGWVVPLATAWVLARALFDFSDSDILIRVLGTALVVSVGACALSAIAVGVATLGNRPRDGGRRQIPRLVLALPRLLALLTIAWLLIGGVWQVDLSAALTALGVTSLVISFALQDTLSGIASGFLLLSDQPFQPGDWIEADGLEGRVVDVNWRSSRIQTRNGDLVVVPNSNLANATITNFDEPSRLHRVVVPLQLSYVSAPTVGKQMLLDAAHATPGVLADPPPNVRLVQISDPEVDYMVDLWIDDYSRAPMVTSDFSSLVWYHSARSGVPLPNPAQDLYLFDGAKVALEGRLDRSELRRRLRTSELLQQLSDDDLEALATGATSQTFSAGETVTVHDDVNDLYVIVAGTIKLVVRWIDGTEHSVLEFDVGDLFGVLDHRAADVESVAAVAVTDCELISVPAGNAGLVISRSPLLSGALDQLSATRQRRIARVVRRHRAEAGTDAQPAIDATSRDSSAADGDSR